jgi:hypothetical protein
MCSVFALIYIYIYISVCVSACVCVCMCCDMDWQWLRLALSNRPNRVGVSSPHLRMETHPVFETLCSLCFLEYRTMDKVQNPSNSESCVCIQSAPYVQNHRRPQLSGKIWRNVKKKSLLQIMCFQSQVLEFVYLGWAIMALRSLHISKKILWYSQSDMMAGGEYQ